MTALHKNSANFEARTGDVSPRAGFRVAESRPRHSKFELHNKLRLPRRKALQDYALTRRAASALRYVDLRIVASSLAAFRSSLSRRSALRASTRFWPRQSPSVRCGDKKEPMRRTSAPPGFDPAPSSAPQRPSRVAAFALRSATADVLLKGSCPDLLLPGGDQLHGALTVEFSAQAVHPAEAKHLIDHGEPVDKLMGYPLLVPDQPDALILYVISGQPMAKVFQTRDLDLGETFGPNQVSSLPVLPLRVKTEVSQSDRDLRGIGEAGIGFKQDGLIWFSAAGPVPRRPFAAAVLLGDSLDLLAHRAAAAKLSNAPSRCLHRFGMIDDRRRVFAGVLA